MSDDASAFEAEATRTRERIAATIDDLQARLAPRALLDEAVTAVGDAGTSAAASLRAAAGRHPIMLGAAGLAVGVGLLATSRVARAKVEYGDGYAAYADYDDGYAANLADADPPSGRARAQLDALHHQAHVTVDDSPLAVVAVGVATGALLGAVIPVSPVETSLFGEINARLAAAGAAAVDAAKDEFDLSKLSLRGGTAGIAERLTASLVLIVGAAGGALLRPVSRG